MYENENEPEYVAQTRAYAQHRNNDTHKHSGTPTTTYFNSLIGKRIRPHVDTKDSVLHLHEPYTGDNEPNRYRLRLHHPNSGVSDVSLALDAGEFESYLFGMIDALEDDIGRLSETADEEDSE